MLFRSHFYRIRRTHVPLLRQQTLLFHTNQQAIGCMHQRIWVPCAWHTRTTKRPGVTMIGPCILAAGNIFRGRYTSTTYTRAEPPDVGSAPDDPKTTTQPNYSSRFTHQAFPASLLVRLRFYLEKLAIVLLLFVYARIG